MTNGRVEVITSVERRRGGRVLSRSGSSLLRWSQGRLRRKWRVPQARAKCVDGGVICVPGLMAARHSPL
jgi:hypothetical protein